MTLNQSIAARKRVNNTKAETKALVQASKILSEQSGVHVYPKDVKLVRDVYISLLAEEVPMGLRASTYRDLIGRSDEPMVQLKTLESIQRLEGLHDKDNKEDKPQAAPLFALPAGTRLKLEIDTQPATVIDTTTTQSLHTALQDDDNRQDTND